MVTITRTFEAFTLEEMVEMGNKWRLENFPNSRYWWVNVDINEAFTFNEEYLYTGEMEVRANVREVHEV